MVRGQALSIGKKKTAKFERCVMHLKDQGKSVGAAHRVCNDSLQGKIQRKKK
jgi:hypothetical protein